MHDYVMLSTSTLRILEIHTLRKRDTSLWWRSSVIHAESTGCQARISWIRMQHIYIASVYNVADTSKLLLKPRCNTIVATRGILEDACHLFLEFLLIHYLCVGCRLFRFSPMFRLLPSLIFPTFFLSSVSSVVWRPASFKHSACITRMRYQHWSDMFLIPTTASCVHSW